MRSIFHNPILASALMAATFAASSAMAETTLKVPFSFTAAGKNLPAGLYSVKKDSTGNFVTLTSKDSLQSYTWVLGPGAPDPTDKSIVLKFDDLGQTHALRSIQFKSMTTAQLDKRAAETERASARLSQGR
jgi:hypothetical protein